MEQALKAALSLYTPVVMLILCCITLPGQCAFVWAQAGWGDDARDPLEAPLNPHFSQEALSQYSSSTQRNLARLDEDRIDFDLLEELVTYIDQEYGDGAILVFLPGMHPSKLLK